MCTHRTKFFKVNFAIFIPVSKQNCFVYNLLKLRVLEVITHHHFQNLLTDKLHNVSINYMVQYLKQLILEIFLFWDVTKW